MEYLAKYDKILGITKDDVLQFDNPNISRSSFDKTDLNIK